jgi:hypothetical protein
MHSSLRLPPAVLVVAALAVPAPSWPAAERVRGASPGERERETAIATTCPTFSWTPHPGAKGYEIVAYRVDDAVPGVGSPVLVHRVAGAALSWTPALADCFAPGESFAWLVRAQGLARAETSSELSEPLFFRTPAAPTFEELERAIGVLHAWRESKSGDVAKAQSSSSRGQSPPSGTITQATASSVTTATFAMRGTWSTPAGHAVIGINQAAGGAGIAAANTAGGTDLLLDGAANSLADTHLTESGLDRPSAVDQVFAFANSGAGVLSLQVDGTISGNGSGLSNVNAATLGGVAPAGFAGSSQACSAGSYVSGIDANGDVVCSSLAGYVNANCVLYFGWRDACDGCTSGPFKWGQVRPSGCANGAGANDTCESVLLGTETIDLFGLNTDGDVADDDKFYLGFKCF